MAERPPRGEVWRLLEGARQVPGERLLPFLKEISRFPDEEVLAAAREHPQGMREVLARGLASESVGCEVEALSLLQLLGAEMGAEFLDRLLTRLSTLPRPQGGEGSDVLRESDYHMLEACLIAALAEIPGAEERAAPLLTEILREQGAQLRPTHPDITLLALLKLLPRASAPCQDRFGEVVADVYSSASEERAWLPLEAADASYAYRVPAFAEAARQSARQRPEFAARAVRYLAPEVARQLVLEWCHSSTEDVEGLLDSLENPPRREEVLTSELWGSLLAWPGQEIRLLALRRCSRPESGGAERPLPLPAESEPSSSRRSVFP